MQEKNMYPKTALKKSKNSFNRFDCRAVGRSENPGVPVLFGGHNLPLLVEIRVTDLPKDNTPGL